MTACARLEQRRSPAAARRVGRRGGAGAPHDEPFDAGGEACDQGVVEQGDVAPAIAVAARREDRSADAVTVRELGFDIGGRHGRFRMADIDEVCAERIGVAGRVGESFDPRRAVFLDTETSDLAGGASVYVFMVGLLLVDGDEVVVRQVLLDGPEGEEVFLERVVEAMDGRDQIVSFSGKSFDRHRLDDRFALLRGERPMVELPHVDLYHLGRRLFQGALPGHPAAHLRGAAPRGPPRR